MRSLDILEAPSPNHGERRGGARPELVVIHYTAMSTAEAALARLRDPAAEVSAHWLVAGDGRVWRLVDEARRAWHAGAGTWGGAGDVNSRSIGIELANPGDAPFPEPQMAALEALLREALARWAIPPAGVIGHADMAPERKADPGPRFDWRRLARAGLAVWLDPARTTEAGEVPARGRDRAGGGGGSPARAAATASAFRAAARRFGYPVAAEGPWDAAARAAARAFRERFRPWERAEDGGAASDAPLDAAALAHLEALAARWPHHIAAEPGRD